MGSWEDLAAYLAALPERDRRLFARHAGLAGPDVPGDPPAALAVLRAYAQNDPAATPSGLLAIAGAQAGAGGEPELARGLGTEALALAATAEERQLGHVCLAQTLFRNRGDAEDLAGFEEHCRAAVDLGHAGTFCYERLAVLYEFRGEREAAIRICRRAVEILGAGDPGGDPRSAGRFQRRLERLLGERGRSRGRD